MDELTAKAKASARLRMHYDMRDRAEDGSMRMLNAIEPGSVIPVHRDRMMIIALYSAKILDGNYAGNKWFTGCLQGGYCQELIVRCPLVIILVAIYQQKGQSYKLDYLN